MDSRQVHVGDDSLFQCIRELRTALGDGQRQIVKLVSGRGYTFDAEVQIEPAAGESQSITQWEKTHPAERQTCDNESAWK